MQQLKNTKIYGYDKTEKRLKLSTILLPVYRTKLCHNTTKLLFQIKQTLFELHVSKRVFQSVHSLIDCAVLLFIMKL